jgi:Transcription factor WhiB
MTITSTRLWFWGGDPDDGSYRSDPGRKCKNEPEIYFSYEPEALARARALCITCPFRRQCTRYSIAHFDEVPYGIWAGLTEMERRKISEGRQPFIDWAEDWKQDRRANYTVPITHAVERRNRRQGISKRDGNRAEIPPCDQGHHAPLVHRAGRSKGKQRYRCEECHTTFLREEL